MDGYGTEPEEMERRWAAFQRAGHDWVHAESGLALLCSAARILPEVFDVDSGYFIYRGPPARPAGGGLQPAAARCAWGAWAGMDARIQMHVDRDRALTSHSCTMSWIDAGRVHDYEYSILGHPDVRVAGSWELSLRGRPAGALVAGCRERPGCSGVWMAIAAAQISLVLELLLGRRAAEERSMLDPLTGLYNRRGVLSKWPALLASAKESGKAVLIGVVDLNGLKAINDEEGHAAGDRAILSVASALRKWAQPDDVVGRWGGDEFVFVCRNPPGRDPAEREVFRDRFLAAAKPYSVSVGWAEFGADGDTWEQCLQAADQRMYRRKGER